MRANAYAIVVVPDAKVDQARAYASTLYGETQTDAFTVLLSASGAFPATHWATQTGVSTAIRNRIGNLPAGVKWWAYSLAGNLLGSNVANPPAQLDFDACIATLGLQRIPRTDI